MKSFLSRIVLSAAGVILASAFCVAASLTKYVNPFIGTAYVGHTHPAAMVPFGMVQVGPDNLCNSGDWSFCSGYNDKSDVITGFSHTHLSGTGCPDMGDILFMPVTGDVTFACSDGGYASKFSHKTEEAGPGFYKVFLDKYGVKVELTATQRAGFHRYTFPRNGKSGVMIDLEHGTGDHTTQSFIKVIDSQTIGGFRRSSGFVNDHQYFFYARFSKPFDKTITFVDGKTGAGKDVEGTVTKVLVQFATGESEAVEVKVGLSTASVENAKMNLDKEMPGWQFDKVRRQAESVWNAYLGRVQVEPLNGRDLTAFYTALYHALIMPNLITDVDGSYVGWDHQLHKSGKGDMYTNFSLWDTYRAEHPFLNLVYPEINSKLVQSLIEKYRQTGMLATNEYGLCETWCMIGNHAVDVIADAYLKGDRSFDAEYAYEAMKHSMTESHPKSDWKMYDEYGYFPFEDSDVESVSRTLETCYDDWCVALMAKALGKTEDYEYFSRRSQNYRNLFDSRTGFMRSRGKDGKWLSAFDPCALVTDPVTHRRDYTEGNAWQWTWHVQNDPEGLVSLFGSKEAFVKKLDSLFTLTPGQLPGLDELPDVTGLYGIYCQGNEPSHHVAYLFNYAGRQDLTAEIVRKIFNEFYIPERDGLCGNDDCGQMSSWFIFSAMGFYPVCPVSGEYIFGAPQVKKATLKLPGGKTFRITARNLSASNEYVGSVKLNGKPHDMHSIRFEDIVKGGTLEYEMTSR